MPYETAIAQARSVINLKEMRLQSNAIIRKRQLRQKQEQLKASERLCHSKSNQHAIKMLTHARNTKNSKSKRRLQPPVKKVCHCKCECNRPVNLEPVTRQQPNRIQGLINETKAACLRFATMQPHISRQHSKWLLLIEQIFSTVGELERSLVVDHQKDFELRMTLERKQEKIKELQYSLDMEKERNERLMQLIRRADGYFSSDDEEDNCNEDLETGNSTLDTYGTVSPLLQRQKYEDLYKTYTRTQRQLLSMQKELNIRICEKEDIQGRYEHLLSEYRTMQKRVEELCYKYLRLRARKNLETDRFRNALRIASDCVIAAQNIVEQAETQCACHIRFKRNLHLLIKALRPLEYAKK